LTNARERLNGFKRALREAKIHIAAEYLQETTFDKHGGHSKTHLLLRLIPPPTAIFAGNAMMALGALRASGKLGCAVRRMFQSSDLTILTSRN
jgi:LacI family transcriptional regulator